MDAPASSLSPRSSKSAWSAVAVGIFCLVGAVRIASTYRVLSQTIDEPVHIAAGFELLSRHTYELDPEHPPLARIAFALQPWLTGARVSTDSDRIEQGNEILLWKGRYRHNLFGTRAGNLPFFFLTVLVVAMWARRLFGDTGSVVAAAIVSSIPVLLGHAGLATTDMAVTATTVAAAYAFARWIEDPSWPRALILAAAVAAGMLSKFSFPIFFGAVVVALIVCRGAASRTHGTASRSSHSTIRRWAQVAVAFVLVTVVTWAAYGFTVGKINDLRVKLWPADSSVGVAAKYARVAGYEWVRSDLIEDYWRYSRGSATTGRHVDFVDWARAAGYPSPLAGRRGNTMIGRPPLPARSRADRLLEPFRAAIQRASLRRVPAPQLFAGLSFLTWHNRAGHVSYFLGRYSDSGWWYYFPVIFFFKTPLALMLLWIAGALFLSDGSAAVGHENGVNAGYERVAVALAPLAIIAIAMTSAINIGVRHVLPAYPFFAIVAAAGVVTLWRRSRIVAAVLLAWYFIAGAVIHPDSIAYFNELAGRHPERIAVDSNLDWGQDLLRLGEEMKARRVERLQFAYFSSVDPARLGIPMTLLAPQRRVQGWVAVSESTRALEDRGEGFRWLDGYRPVARVGKSIRLYEIPP